MTRRKNASRRPTIAAVLGLLGLALAATACARAPDRAATPPSPPPGRAVPYAPYIDVTVDRPTLTEVADATGQKAFTLAFILAGGGRCIPSWGNQLPLDDPRVVGQVKALRARGGDVVVSSGGADGPYLENACHSADALAAAYEKALDAVGSRHLDVDVEGDVPVERVNQALAKVQRERGVTVTYTLPIQDQGYGAAPFSVRILRSAAEHGLDVTVNVMVMNFEHTGDWGDAMVSAARATVGQMRDVWPDKSEAQLYGMLGITPMIGRNDNGMTTTRQDARTLLAFARSHRIGYIGFWSVDRDNGGCPGKGASDTCSGVSQTAYEFTDIFKAFAE